MGVNPKNGGEIPNNPWVWTPKNDQHLGCEMGVATFTKVVVDVLGAKGEVVRIDSRCESVVS